MYFLYSLDAPAEVEIEIYNVAGERVTVLRAPAGPVGSGRTAWDLREVAPGVYLYRLRVLAAAGTRTTPWKKCVIVKQ